MVDDFDELLSLTQDDLPAVHPTGGDETPEQAPPEEKPTPEEKPVAPTPEPTKAKRTRRSPVKAAVPNPEPVDANAARIAELEAQLAQPAPVYRDDEPDEEDPVVLQQKARIKELEDQLARRNADRAENAPAQLVRAEGSSKILIHFEEDGFNAFGTTWYRGQEFEYTRDSVVYQRTLDSKGNSWLDLAEDRNAQLARWGRVYFAPGPFVPRKGEQFTDALVGEDARRGRAVPISQA